MKVANKNMTVMWKNEAKGPYKWHHTYMMQSLEGDLYIWTTTVSGGCGDVPSVGDRITILTSDLLGETSLQDDQKLIRITKVKWEKQS